MNKLPKVTTLPKPQKVQTVQKVSTLHKTKKVQTVQKPPQPLK